MISTGIPGVYANPDRKNGAVRDIRRIATLESAVEMLGGQAPLATAIGIDARLLRKKMSAERPIHDAELAAAARAVSARARAADDLAGRLSALATGGAGE